MLDQNTDRIWYVIGAVLIGAAIILIANGTLPDLFGQVADTYGEKTEEAAGAMEEMVTGEPVENYGSLEDYLLATYGAEPNVASIHISEVSHPNYAEEGSLLYYEMPKTTYHNMATYGETMEHSEDNVVSIGDARYIKDESTGTHVRDQTQEAALEENLITAKVVLADPDFNTMASGQYEYTKDSPDMRQRLNELDNGLSDELQAAHAERGNALSEQLSTEMNILTGENIHIDASGTYSYDVVSINGVDYLREHITLEWDKDKVMEILGPLLG